jgi:hypothetical protein
MKCNLAMSSVLMGEGEHFFAGINLHELGFAPVETVAGESATHVLIRPLLGPQRERCSRSHQAATFNPTAITRLSKAVTTCWYKRSSWLRHSVVQWRSAG